MCCKAVPKILKFMSDELSTKIILEKRTNYKTKIQFLQPLS